MSADFEARIVAELRADCAEAALSEARKQIVIISLSTPLEDELSAKIDVALKYLAMEQGYTLGGLARLLVDCQKRMAVDWEEIGRLMRDISRLSGGAR